MRGKRKAYRHRWVLCLLAVWVIGYSLACSPPRLRYRPLNVTYLPRLVKGQPEHLPPQRILVLFPIDKRPGFVVRKGAIPPIVSGADIVREKPAGEVLPRIPYPVVGFRGTSSKGSFFLQDPSSFSPPDLPRLLFFMGNLQETVQQALATHLHEGRLQVMIVPFSYPSERPLAEEIAADYALGCTIEEFALRSLFYYVETLTFGFYPVLGPTWVQVTLKLILYRWPSGEQLWEGQVGEQLVDPVPGDNMHLYGTMGEAMSMALSRAVGSFLVIQAVQDILSHPQAQSAPLNPRGQYRPQSQAPSSPLQLRASSAL